MTKHKQPRILPSAKLRNIMVEKVKILTENLRFISSSYSGKIQNRNVHEWAIYLGMITFYVLFTCAIFNSTISISDKVTFKIILFIYIFAFFGSLFIFLTHCANNKNQKIYMEADNLIVNVLKSHTILDETAFKNNMLGEYKPFRNRAAIGRHLTLLIQVAILFSFAHMVHQSIKIKAQGNNSAPHYCPVISRINSIE